MSLEKRMVDLHKCQTILKELRRSWTEKETGHHKSHENLSELHMNSKKEQVHRKSQKMRLVHCTS